LAASYSTFSEFEVRSLLTRRLTRRAPRSAPPAAAMTNRGEPVLDLDYFRRFRVQ
jgi:hypothetical protein